MCNTVSVGTVYLPERIELFNRWLTGELKRRGWSDYHLAKKSGLTPSVISRARAGTLPKWDACVKIASGLSLPAEFVFRAAGLLPENPGEDPALAKLIMLYNRANPAQRIEIIHFAQFILQK